MGVRKGSSSETTCTIWSALKVRTFLVIKEVEVCLTIIRIKTCERLSQVSGFVTYTDISLLFQILNFDI